VHKTIPKIQKKKRKQFFFNFKEAVTAAAICRNEPDHVPVYVPPKNLKKILLPSRSAKRNEYRLPDMPHLKLDSLTKLFLNSKLSLTCKIVARNDGLLSGELETEHGFDNDYGDCDDMDDSHCGIVDDRVDFENDASTNSGMGMQYNDLIDQEPQVENISLAYETTAKRVDVRHVKRNLWNHVAPEHEKDSDAKNTEKKITDISSKKSETLSFKETMLAVKNTVPENVTVSYFFICMLHLANEKGLEFTGDDNLEDFMITN
jgi:condensin complex subunit 2